MKSITLREARKRRGWTQEQLEAVSGVDQAIISRLERGAISDPQLATARKLAAALRVNLASLQFTADHSDAA